MLTPTGRVLVDHEVKLEPSAAAGDERVRPVNAAAEGHHVHFAQCRCGIRLYQDAGDDFGAQSGLADEWAQFAPSTGGPNRRQESHGHALGTAPWYEVESFAVLAWPLSAHVIQLQVVEADAAFGLVALGQRQREELLGGFGGFALIHSPDALLHQWCGRHVFQQDRQRQIALARSFVQSVHADLNRAE